MSQLFPWLTLAAIIWLQALSGTGTDFPAYSSLVKSRLGFTQVQLNNLAVASDAGKLFGWLSGVAATHLPLWSVLTIGSTIGFAGYGLQYLFLANKIAALSYPHYLFLQVLQRSKYIVSRPASFFLILILTKICLFISTAIIGVCSGAITSIAVSMTADLFGPENFSINHNIVIANIPIGSLVFSYIAAILYDREKGGGGDGRGLCVGMHCYRTTFIRWGSICTFGQSLALPSTFGLVKLSPKDGHVEDCVDQTQTLNWIQFGLWRHLGPNWASSKSFLDLLAHP